MNIVGFLSTLGSRAHTLEAKSPKRLVQTLDEGFSAWYDGFLGLTSSQGPMYPTAGYLDIGLRKFNNIGFGEYRKIAYLDSKPL